MDEPSAPIFFFAPFVSSPMRVQPAWVDQNGRMNTTYYHVLFERAADEAFGIIGLGPDTLIAREASLFATEVHTLHQRELAGNDVVRVTLQLIDHDWRRLHFYLEIRHTEEGWLAASSEHLATHVNAATRQVTEFPSDVMGNLAVMKASHVRLRRPPTLGRSVALPLRDGETPEPILATGTRH